MILLVLIAIAGIDLQGTYAAGPVLLTVGAHLFVRSMLMFPEEG